MTNAQPCLGSIALFGARGAIGHALSAHLDARGQPYRAVGRDVDALRQTFPRADIVGADFLSGEGIDAAARNIDSVFYLAGTEYTHFERHPVMVRHALASAASMGARRFIHIAPVYSYAPAKGGRVAETHSHVPTTRKGRWRLEQEQAVLAADDPSGMRTSIVHLPDFYGPYADNSIANYFLREAVDGKTATFIGPLDATREFVYVPDVAVPLLALASIVDVYGTCWNIGGTTIEARAFTKLAFEVLGSPPKVRPVSKIMLQAFGLFNPTMRELAEMYYLDEGDVILDDTKLQSRLGALDKTPFRQGLGATIEWMKSGR
jgi:nucleoside-diphosphate-sugar epimerase